MAIRLISSFIGIAVALVVLFLNETFLFPIAIAALIGIILYELIKAVDGLQFWLASAGVMLYGCATPFLTFYGLETFVMPVQFLCLMLVFLELILHSQTFRIEQIAFMIMSSILVTKSLDCLIHLKNMDDHGMLYVVLGLCGGWIADSGAYFAGVALGKHKLCPNISPKKTIEGFVGGLLSNAVVFVLICFVYSLIMQKYGTPIEVRYIEIAVLGLVCAAISVLGDLCASVVKRQKRIKDYGNIMPGHGGLMDRFDSVLFVVPSLYVFLSVFSIIK